MSAVFHNSSPTGLPGNKTPPTIKMTCLQELIAPAVLVSQNISENALLGMEAEEILALQELGSWSEKDHSE